MMTIVRSRKSILFPLVGFLIAAMLLTFYPLLIAQGAPVTALSDLLSDSRPSAASDHTVTFTTPTGVAAGETIEVTFASGFGLGSVVLADLDLEDDTTDKTLAATCSGATWGAAVSGQVITFTSCSDTITAGSIVEVLVGTVADSGVNQITNNSAAAVYDVTIGGSMTDSGTVKISVIAGVAVTAVISESLTFTVAGVTGCDPPTDAGDVDVNATATDLNYPNPVVTETFNDSCQDLTVNTNADSGYQTTVKILDELEKGGGTEILMGTCDGACSITVSAPWATDTNNGFAYCLDDQAGDAAATADSTEWTAAQHCGGGSVAFKLHPVNPGDAQTDAPEPIMSAPNVAGIQAGGDITRIAHRLSVDAAQSAGTYTGTIVYVTTPTY